MTQDEARKGFLNDLQAVLDKWDAEIGTAHGDDGLFIALFRNRPRMDQVWIIKDSVVAKEPTT